MINTHFAAVQWKIPLWVLLTPHHLY